MVLPCLYGYLWLTAAFFSTFLFLFPIFCFQILSFSLVVILLRSAVYRIPLCKSDCMLVSCYLFPPQNHRLREATKPQEKQPKQKQKEKHSNKRNYQQTVPHQQWTWCGRRSFITRRKYQSNDITTAICKIYIFQKKSQILSFIT